MTFAFGKSKEFFEPVKIGAVKVIILISENFCFLILNGYELSGSLDYSSQDFFSKPFLADGKMEPLHSLSVLTFAPFQRESLWSTQFD